MGIYQKLANIQKELFVPKANRNDFGKYNYRSCEDIFKTVKPLLDKNNCTLFMNNEMVQVGDRNYVNATATLVDLESGETMTVSAQAREEETKKGMDESQITGTSSSYARKYALAGLFCIDNEKDSDATNTHDKEEEFNEKVEDIKKMKIADVKVNILKDKCKDSEVNEEWLAGTYKHKDLTEITEGEFSAIINNWDKFVAKAKEQ